MPYIVPAYVLPYSGVDNDGLMYMNKQPPKRPKQLLVDDVVISVSVANSTLPPVGQSPQKVPVSDFQKQLTERNNLSNNGLESGKFPVLAVVTGAADCTSLHKFFNAMPANSGFGFIICLHHVSNPEDWPSGFIDGLTSMSVIQLATGQPAEVIQPNTLYVGEAGAELQIKDNKLSIKSDDTIAPHYVVDHFLKAFAEDQGEYAGGVFLSGKGDDYSRGLKAIKENYGVVFCQDTLSAVGQELDLSVLENDFVDYVLVPEDMPARLISYFKWCERTDTEVKKQLSLDPALMDELTGIIRNRTGHDFSQYKKGTITRRTEHRMNLRQYSSFSEYLVLLNESEDETRSLFANLLIGLTRFFRDEESFNRLSNTVIPGLMKNRKKGNNNFRVWVPACATGQEAYSLGIILIEQAEKLGKKIQIQIFATDIDEKALSIARDGKYPSSIEEEIEPERLQRFFVKEADGGYRTSKLLRDLIVFAYHNVISDPPFIHLDLLSCRNLLIYFNANLQQEILPVFHYSLRPDGCLVLGSSESISYASGYFSIVDKHWKIFVRKELSPGSLRGFVALPKSKVKRRKGVKLSSAEVPEVPDVPERNTNLQLIEAILLNSNIDPAVVINRKFDILYVHGRTGNFLEPAPGEAKMNLLDMARPDIQSRVESAVQEVLEHATTVTCAPFELGDTAHPLVLEITVRPVVKSGLMQSLMIVIFKEIDLQDRETSKVAVANQPKTARSVDDLDTELRQTRRILQNTIEELEASNEDMRSRNEELQATNEELQSANEEIETTKEELLSNNEEYDTVNIDLLTRIAELSSINDDLQNFLDSTAIATIFLDSKLKVRRFTTKIAAVAPLGPQDIDRPLSDISTSIIDFDLSAVSRLVLEDFEVRKQEVRTRDGKAYTIKIRPYRMVSRIVDGVVITFEDITELTRLSENALKSETRFRSAFDMSKDGCTIMKDGRYIDINDAGLKMLKMSREEVLGLKIGSLSPPLQPDGSESTIKFQEHAKYAVENGSTRFIWTMKNSQGESCRVEYVLSAFEVDGHAALYGSARLIDHQLDGADTQH